MTTSRGGADGVSTTVDVVVAGAGPIGLSAALELRRRGVEVLVVDRLRQPANFAKAVGVQPRTLELWDMAGVARRALDAAITMRGQIFYVNGAQTAKIDLELPDEIPYRFIALPQYESERVLAEAIAEWGTHVERGTEFLGFTQDESGVTSTLSSAGVERTVRSRFLVGADGAHSAVRKGLGLTFEGGASAEEYMLGDVELDWDMPTGYGIRASHHNEDGVVDDLLVCIPLPGHKRYRASMLVPPELSTDSDSGDGITHGLEGARAPELHHIQAVLDRLVAGADHRVRNAMVVGLPDQPSARGPLRLRTGFRRRRRRTHPSAHRRPGHEHQRAGRVQPRLEAGARGAWQGRAGSARQLQHRTAPGGRGSRRPPVQSARAGIGADLTDMAAILAREAQLLVGYPDSPIVAESVTEGRLAGGPIAGQRAPDASGLSQACVGYPIRLFDLFRHGDHTLLLWAGDAEAARAQRDVAESLEEQLGGAVRGHVIAASGSVVDASGALLVDAADRFAAAYGTAGTARAAYLIRPDGYVSYRTDTADPSERASGTPA